MNDLDKFNVYSKRLNGMRTTDALYVSILERDGSQMIA
jgi:hypothetical protein